MRDAVGGADYYYFLKDLYTVEGLVNSKLHEVERYTYDAYGKPSITIVPIWDLDYNGVTNSGDRGHVTANYGDPADKGPIYDFDGDGTIDSTDRDLVNPHFGKNLTASKVSGIDNPYLFTGRDLDVLFNGPGDSGDDHDFRIQYNRARYYDPENGRWLQRDPLEYVDGMSLYEYVRSGPSQNIDPEGLTCNVCGPDVSRQVRSAIRKVTIKYNRLTAAQKGNACGAFTSQTPDFLRGGAPMYLNAWDIIELWNKAWINAPPYSPPCATAPPCVDTVEVDGNCYYAGSVNYMIFGVMWRLCGNLQVTGNALIWAYKGNIPGLRPAAGNYVPSQGWFDAGYLGWPGGGVLAPAADRPDCSPTCPVPYAGAPFTLYWGTVGFF